MCTDKAKSPCACRFASTSSDHSISDGETELETFPRRHSHREQKRSGDRILGYSVRNYRSPGRHWRLTFRVGDHQLATWSPKKKKKKEKKENRAVANLSQRRRADRERAFFLPFFRFGLIENETRIAKLPPVTRTRGAVQSSTVQSLRSRCFPHVRLQDRQQRDKTTPCPNTHRPRNSKADLRFLRCYVEKEGGRIQSGHFSFPFRFDRVRDTDCETLTCHVHARRYSAVFSATSLSTRVVERTKRHNDGTILWQKKAGGSTA